MSIVERYDALIASLQQEARLNSFKALLAMMAHIRREVDLYGRPLWLVRLRPRNHDHLDPVYSVRVRLDPWPAGIEPLLEVRPSGDLP